jgi:transposase-like protein
VQAVHAALLEVRVDGDLLPASIVAKKLGVSKQLVHWWVRNGHLAPAETVNGRKLYSLKEAARVEREMKRSPQSRRQAVA